MISIEEGLRRVAGGLVYFPDDRPGITRRRRGRGFSYLAPDGSVIRNAAERKRIEALAVPPAYESVWISPLPNGHLQATGRDARGRKQYRYHPNWTEQRSRRKYRQLAEFGRTLPRLRHRIAQGLRAPAGSLELAVAAVLALLDRAAIRIGHPDYARDNESFGATTLLADHASFDGDRVELCFPGKGGSEVACRLHGARLQRALHRIQDLPGGALISWLDETETVRSVRSDMINDRLAGICGDGITAKTFRTWNGTHAAFCRALEPGPLKISDLAEAASERLCNTPAIARSSYIHPKVIRLAESDPGRRVARLERLQDVGLTGLRAGEGKLIDFLER
jgi:DNA topoisomerase-1